MVGTTIRSSIAVLQSIIARFQAEFPDSEQLVTGNILHLRFLYWENLLLTRTIRGLGNGPLQIYGGIQWQSI